MEVGSNNFLLFVFILFLFFIFDYKIKYQKVRNFWLKALPQEMRATQLHD